MVLNIVWDLPRRNLNEKGRTAAENKLNINSADAEMISNSLKGIGLKKAVAIVEYREAYGPFKHIEELASVKGIGKKTVQKNSALIAIK